MYSYHTSRKLRFVQCACAISWSLLAAGPIFGFAALKPILILEKVYENECDTSVNSTNYLSNFALDPNAFGSLTGHLLSELSVSKNEKSPVAKCSAQDLKLNMMFTVGAVMTNTSAIVIGKVLDKYGPKVCGLIGVLLLYFACFVFIFAKQIEKTFNSSYFDPYMIGYTALALGGPSTYMSSFHLSNTFPEKSGTILAFLNGAFDASSAVFLLYKVLYKHSNTLSLDKFFRIFLVVPTFITLAQIFIMPNSSYIAPPDTSLFNNGSRSSQENDNEPTETEPLLGNSGDNPRQLQRRDSIGDALKQHYVYEDDEELFDNGGKLYGILHGYSSEYQMKTPWFYLLCAFTAIQMLRLNYFIATINTQYTYLLGSADNAEPLTRFFNLALPLGGILSIPLVGYYLDNYSTVASFATLLALSLFVGIVGLVGNFYFGVVNICFFVLNRPYFYTAISDFCAKIFGFDTFGTVYGAIICIAGLFNLLQCSLDNITHSNFGMNPSPINLLLVCITIIIGGVTFYYMKHQSMLYKERTNRSVPSVSV
ncbi:DEHA2E22352p [Debaryomyces hansenii CBS767]|uniref:DEHA2E22352p n=1 Tax=Debaryomyces hansenii (strain ATCC 36239 / CBS 767 / BCRC 21394 / JCM 1990 / NBRC 0083 / IGC 2968) TaxID=284592 RepID=B5RU57_DEBHA|nr:DEHA2E22352p [Debaryomyces hansenii CBS767]CAR65868.1 DEHA2E22352p [Debaryomyces hansenii CBS767]|eukprot:XP_002770527.1 DEHA2E22352p [Debaryomyces hansenii CBS767]